VILAPYKLNMFVEGTADVKRMQQKKKKTADK
jgi:hypothetical protein